MKPFLQLDMITVYQTNQILETLTLKLKICIVLNNI